MSVRWTEAEDAVLRREYTRLTCAQIGKALGRTRGSVAKRAWDLRISKGVVFAFWTPEEVARLRELFPTTTLVALSRIFDRTTGSVRNKARELGLERSPDFHRDANRRAAEARRASAAFHQGRAGMFDNQGLWTQTMDAAKHLQRLAPIHRCDEAGVFDPKGDFWRFGARVMDAAAVEDRAARAGWSPPATGAAPMAVAA